jgi:hypothetical protein
MFANIRLGSKKISGTNSLAYFGEERERKDMFYIIDPKNER